ncbi:MAG: hypothetical protein EPN47_04090 [Acidobacteria bacterium]|nr:MAG: hypothetical protein EPN47_04090 [Acidobacteriota bacterium]
MLCRYWFEFDLSHSQARQVPDGLGCGVTAFDYEDAITLMKDRVFEGGELPPIRNVIEDVDISTLDEKQVRPNMDIPFFRGVWFPKRPSKSR